MQIALGDYVLLDSKHMKVKIEYARKFMHVKSKSSQPSDQALRSKGYSIDIRISRILSPILKIRDISELYSLPVCNCSKEKLCDRACPLSDL